MQPLRHGQSLIETLTRYGKPLENYRVITLAESKTFPHDSSCSMCLDVKRICETLDPKLFSAVTFDWHLIGIIA